MKIDREALEDYIANHQYEIMKEAVESGEVTDTEIVDVVVFNDVLKEQVILRLLANKKLAERVMDSYRQAEAEMPDSE